MLAKELIYLHFGRQCPGSFLAEQAKRAANMLQVPLRDIDASERPDLAEHYNLFYPGAVFMEDVPLVYGSAAQMVESYLRRGPLPGVQHYEAKPLGQVERVEILHAGNCGCAFGSCLPSLSDSQSRQKAEWLRTMANSGFAGLIGWQGEQVVGFVEVLPETAIPYSLGVKRPEYGFITCLYSPIEWGLDKDYRVSLLEHLFSHAMQQGYHGLSVVSGVETPYPNGPMAVFEHLGFDRVKQMGRVLLKHKWEEAWLMQKQL